ncbi:MAG: hypothetical protein HQL30_12095 [Candidatus Omnitrophica bacterium]|nr:hypothetical protein [Candidatus Omnitrophota bacterium]
MKTLFISDIAQIAWCQQKARYRCQEHASIYKYSHGKQKDLAQEMASNATIDKYVYFSKNEFARVGFEEFLKTINYSIVTKSYYLSSKKKFDSFMLLEDEWIIGQPYIKTPQNIFSKIKKRYLPVFVARRNQIIRKNPFAVGISDFWLTYLLEESQDSMGCEIVNMYDPFSMGRYLEYRYSKKYPKVCKCFRWKKYYILAVPDGVTRKYCYEFKSAKTDYCWRDSFPVAITQANLYSYFFKKPYCRVEFLFKDSLKTRSVLRKTDGKSALDALNMIDGLLKNKIKAVAPKKYKCNYCDFRSRCGLNKKPNKKEAAKNKL